MPKYIFHGTNAKLLDEGLVAGTYFSDDLEIALKYGNNLFVFDIENKENVFTKTFDGHYVSVCFIPLMHLHNLRNHD